MLTTSSIDKRLYRNIVLTNKLQCLLISDSDSEKSSACCDVQVGSLSDPIDAQGLAHFLEHMLFLGTEKYPVENSYSSFLNAHGGYSNAYTSQENTVYYFDVQNDAFEQALDMFASFFLCPLFTESSTSREINAVDSENKKNLQSDSWRKFQLLKSLAREGHPISMFSTGNIETLGQNSDPAKPNSSDASTPPPLRIRDLMMEFHEKNYSANLMKLVLYSNQSLDAMQSWAESLFSGIRNKDLSRKVVSDDAYGNAQLRKYLEIVPIRDMKKIEVLFPIPPIEHLYRSKPTRYLCHLLGHESDGSLLAALKQRRWAQALSAYCSPSLRDLAFLGVTIELTQEGLAHIDDVVEGLFAYIGLLRKEGVLPWVWEELKDTADTHFRFLNKVEPAEYATQLAENMHKYPPEDVLAGGELLFQMDLPAVSTYLSALVPERCIVLVMNSAFAGRTSKKEKWYGTDYNIGDLSVEQLSMWQGALSSGAGEEDRWKDLHMPQPNPFIPTVFDLKSAPSSSSSSSIAAEDVSAVKKENLPPHLLTCPDLVGDAVLGDSDYVEADEEKESQPDPNTPPPPPVDDNEEGDGEEEGEEEEGEESADQPPSPVSVPVGQGHPVLMWFKGDDLWGVPKGGVYLTLESGFCSGGPLAVALTDLLAQLLKEKLSEFSYYADCAGLQYDVQLSRGGLELSVRGYDHKLRLLLERALQELKRIAQQGDPSSFSDGQEAISAALFERVKERALLSYKNYLFWQPYYHCLYGSLLCMEEPRWSNADKYHALSPASLGDLTSFANAFLRTLKAELLVHGNFLAAEAEGLPDLVQSSLGFKPLPITQEPIRRTVALTQGVEYVFRQHCKGNNPNEVNSAVENIYVVCPSAIHYGSATADTDALMEESCVSLTRTMYASAASASSWPGFLCIEALLELLTHMMSEPAFDQLRTKEQLGYIVFSGIKKIGQVLAVQLIVQSGHRGPAFLDDRVESFLGQYRTELAGYSEEMLGGFVEAVCEKLTEKPKNIDQESATYWEEIKSGSYLFDRRKQLALSLQAATRPDLRNALLQLFDYFLLGTDTRRKMSSQFFGRGAKGKGTGAARSGQRVLIQSAAEFKRSVRLQQVQIVERKTLQKLI